MEREGDKQCLPNFSTSMEGRASMAGRGTQVGRPGLTFPKPERSWVGDAWGELWEGRLPEAGGQGKGAEDKGRGAVGGAGLKWVVVLSFGGFFFSFFCSRRLPSVSFSSWSHRFLSL
jgi:hypothetical protein